jgi:transposase
MKQHPSSPDYRHRGPPESPIRRSCSRSARRGSHGRWTGRFPGARSCRPPFRNLVSQHHSARRREYDYKRHGTTTLFAALNVLDGTVIDRCMQRHRHQEFIRFLNVTEAAVPKGKTIHAIVDNYAPHKHPKVKAWLARHPRWSFHFTPTSASWLNAVEGLFAKLTKRRLKRGVFCSIIELQAAINRFLAETNSDPRPFRWTKDPGKIIAAVKRGHQALDSIH